MGLQRCRMHFYPKLEGQTFLLVYEREKQVFYFKLLLVPLKSYVLCVLECFLGFDGETVESDWHVNFLP
jgi:hypothetical protein